MGWTGIPLSNIGGKSTAGNLKKYFEQEIALDERFKMIHFSKKGNILYMGIERKDEDETAVYAEVIITHVEDGWFEYKELTEFSGPCYHDAPISLLKKLTPTTNEIALEWRESCVQKNEEKKQKRITNGSIILVDPSDWDRLPEGYCAKSDGKFVAKLVQESFFSKRKVTCYVPYSGQKELSEVDESKGSAIAGFKSKLNYTVVGQLN